MARSGIARNGAKRRRVIMGFGGAGSRTKVASHSLLASVQAVTGSWRLLTGSVQTDAQLQVAGCGGKERVMVTVVCAVMPGAQPDVG